MLAGEGIRRRPSQAPSLLEIKARWAVKKGSAGILRLTRN